MPTAYFEVTIDLPNVDCPEDDVKEMCRTLKPLSTLVDGSSLAIDPTTGQIVNGPGAATWHKYTKTFTQLAQAATTFDIELFSLPAGAVIQAIKLKHSAAFTGGTLSAYTLSIGIASNLTKYMAAKSVFAAPTGTNQSIVWAPFFNSLLPPAFVNTDNAIGSLTIGATYTQAQVTALRDGTETLADDARGLRAAVAALGAGAIGAEDHLVANSIRLAAAATGGNLNLATAGSVDVWVLYATLT